MTRRASGRTSANVGRSPKPVEVGLDRARRARRIASRPLRPTVTTVDVAGVLGDLAGGEPDDVRVERPGQRPRSVVISTISRLPPSRLGEERVVLAAEHGREVGEDLVELLAVRPRGERRVLGALAASTPPRTASPG